MTLVAPVAWAQRPDIVTIVVGLADASDVKISLADNTLDLSCVTGEKKYACKYDLYEAIEIEESSHKVSERQIELKLAKKVGSDEYWPRLTKNKLKSDNIKIDWSRWKDADEVDGNDMGDFGMGGMPGMGGMGDLRSMLGGMGGMGGMGMTGMGDMDLPDEDDDDDEGFEPEVENTPEGGSKPEDNEPPALEYTNIQKHREIQKYLKRIFY